MKLVLISDTHTQHRKLTVPDGDVLIHAGDVTNRGEESTILDFNNWLGELPHKYKILIAGNHDFGMDTKTALLTNCIYLHDSGCEIEGMKFWGSPFTPAFMNWAYMLPRGDSIYQKWLTIPHDTDVLITHGPPRGFLDTACPGGEHLGCFDLGNVVSAIAPKLHVFGHIHGGYGEEVGETHYVNAAACDEAYRIANAPVVTEIFSHLKAPYEVSGHSGASILVAEVK